MYPVISTNIRKIGGFRIQGSQLLQIKGLIITGFKCFSVKWITGIVPYEIYCLPQCECNLSVESSSLVWYRPDSLNVDCEYKPATGRLFQSSFFSPSSIFRLLFCEVLLLHLCLEKPKMIMIELKKYKLARAIFGRRMITGAMRPGDKSGCDYFDANNTCFTKSNQG